MRGLVLSNPGAANPLTNFSCPDTTSRGRPARRFFWDRGRRGGVASPAASVDAPSARRESRSRRPTRVRPPSPWNGVHQRRPRHPTRTPRASRQRHGTIHPAEFHRGSTTL